MTFLDQISMSKIIRLKSLFDKILHSLMFSSRSKIIFSDQYNYVLCIGSRFIQWLYRFGAILQFTVNTERIFTLQFYISPKIMHCLLVTKKKRCCKLGNFWIYFKEQKEMWLYTLYINVFLCICMPFQWPPFTERIQENGQTIDYVGFCADLLKELKEELNFTYVRLTT